MKILTLRIVQTSGKMIRLQTPVEDRDTKVKISPEDRTIILGSCFADNIGRKIKEIGFNVCVNPFGTLYNPASISRAVDRLASGKPFTEDECRMMGSGAGLVCSFSHHTSFARKTVQEFLDNANAALAEASGFFRDCNRMIITLGTSWCYRHTGDGLIVSNCLKRDAKEFTRERLAVDETVRLLRHITGDGRRKTVFTVSPIRHLKDGAHGNQLSKAALLLAVDEVCSDSGNCDYFPAYEIVMDELRDYRFYAEDMLHPSLQTVDYIWERFRDSVVPEKDREKVRDMEKAYRRSLHRPNLVL